MDTGGIGEPWTLPVTFRTTSPESFGETVRVAAIGTLVDVKGYTCRASSKTAQHPPTKELQMSDNVRYIVAAITTITRRKAEIAATMYLTLSDI